MEISKYRPLYRKRTLVGLISTTFTPSTKDPSLALMPLTMMKRMEESSYQTIADSFNEGGFIGDPVVACSGIFFILEEGTSASSRIMFGFTFFSSTEGAAGLLSTVILPSAGVEGIGLFRLISSRTSCTASRETGAGV